MGDLSEPKAAGAKGGMGPCSYRRCHVPQTCPFDCLAITAPNPRASKAYLEELVHRVGVSPSEEGTKEVLILAVSDPEGVRIGSGGGTLNAILEVGCWAERSGWAGMKEWMRVCERCSGIVLGCLLCVMFCHTRIGEGVDVAPRSPVSGHC